MTLKHYIPALILLAMIAVCFVVPWVYGWAMIIRRVFP